MFQMFKGPTVDQRKKAYADGLNAGLRDALLLVDTFPRGLFRAVCERHIHASSVLSVQIAAKPMPWGRTRKDFKEGRSIAVVESCTAMAEGLLAVSEESPTLLNGLGEVEFDHIMDMIFATSDVAAAELKSY